MMNVVFAVASNVTSPVCPHSEHSDSSAGLLVASLPRRSPRKKQAVSGICLSGRADTESGMQHMLCRLNDSSQFCHTTSVAVPPRTPLLFCP